MPVSFIVSGFVLSGVLSLCTQPGFKGHLSLRWKAPELLKSVLYPPRTPRASVLGLLSGVQAARHFGIHHNNFEDCLCWLGFTC